MMNQLSLTTYTLLLSVLVAVAHAFEGTDFYNTNYADYVANLGDVGKGVKNAAIGM